VRCLEYGDAVADVASGRNPQSAYLRRRCVREVIAVFEATHGTAPKYANLDKINPGSVILSGVMMLEYMGWNEASNLIINGM